MYYKNIELDNVDEKRIIKKHLMMQMKKNMYYKNIALDDADEKHVL